MKYYLAILLLGMLILPGPAWPSSDTKVIKRVLVLYTLEKGNVGQDIIDAKLREIFGRNENFDVQIYNEYLDLVRFPDVKQIFCLADFLHLKYIREKPDVIFTILPAALDTLEHHEKKLRAAVWRSFAEFNRKAFCFMLLKCKGSEVSGEERVASVARSVKQGY